MFRFEEVRCESQHKLSLQEILTATDETSIQLLQYSGEDFLTGRRRREIF